MTTGQLCSSGSIALFMYFAASAVLLRCTRAQHVSYSEIGEGGCRVTPGGADDKTIIAMTDSESAVACEGQCSAMPTLCNAYAYLERSAGQCYLYSNGPYTHTHLPGNAGWICWADPVALTTGQLSALAGEVGIVDVSHAKVTVTLSRSYTRPVVIAGVLGMEGGAPTVMRIESVLSNSFTMWTQEQDCGDGSGENREVPFYLGRWAPLSSV